MPAIHSTLTQMFGAIEERPRYTECASPLYRCHFAPLRITTVVFGDFSPSGGSANGTTAIGNRQGLVSKLDLTDEESDVAKPSRRPNPATTRANPILRTGGWRAGLSRDFLELAI